MRLTSRVITEPAELSGFWPAWDALLGRTDAGAPMLSSLWLRAWWDVFGGQDGRQLRVLTLWDRDRLVGVAPLVTRRHWYPPAIPFRRLELVGSGEAPGDEILSEYIGPFAERGSEGAVAESIARELSSGEIAWDEVVLGLMDGTLPLAQRLERALASRGAATSLDVVSEAPYITLPATWEAYLAALPSARRYLVTRSLREFEKWAGGPVALRRASTHAEVDEGMRILARLHNQRWQANGKPGAFTSPRFISFHRQVTRALLDRDSLDLCWIEAHGEVIAAAYNVVWNGKSSFYQSGRKLEVPRQVRPGIVLHALLIRRAIEKGLREYDFLGGATQYKTQLALARRPIVTLRAVRTPVLETVRTLAAEGISRARALRQWTVTAARPEGSPSAGLPAASASAD